MNIKSKKNIFLKIYNTSAGTGKTNKLIIKYIFFLYKNINNINFFSKILIITFNKKTSLEIINRIINNLKKLSNKNNNNFYLTKILSKKLNINNKEIYLYSKKLLKNIFFFYNKLSIFTIDKFIYKIYSHSYLLKKNNFLIYNKIYINKIIKKIINNFLYKKKNFNKYILKYINNGIINIENFFYKKIIYFLNYNNFLYIKQNKKKINNNLFLSIKNKKKKIKKKLKIKKIKFFNFLKKKKINKKSFLYSDIPNIFKKKININLIKNIFFKKTIFNKRLIKSLKINNFFSKKINKKQKNKIIKYKKIIKNYLFDYNNFLKKHCYEYIIYNIIDNNFIYIKLLLKIYKIFNKNIFYFNKNKFFNIKQELLYKYEIISNLYKIYFIDEFQDISIDQWNNLNYLFKNILSEGGYIYFLGDIKQSIYGWRNVNSIKILKNIKNIYNNFKIKEITLKKNYRSNYYIILFNNNFYYYIYNFFFKKKYKKIYNKNIIQLNNYKKDGYVKINIYKKKKKLINLLINNIKILINKGYKCKDIIILTIKNNDIEYLIKKLNKKLKKNNIYINKNFFLLNNIIYIKILIQFIKIFYYKNNIKYRINFIFLLKKIKYFKKKIFYKILYNITYKKKNIKNFIKYLKKINIIISYNYLLNLNLYEFFEYIIKKLKFNKFKNIKFISKFLDIIYKFEKKKKNQIYDFIKYWKIYKKNIIINNKVNNNNIINISTIHKIKGLQYKIVLLPFINFNILYNKKNIKNLNNFKILFNFKKKKKYKNIIKNFLIYNQIENFNILYVATTRAKKKLIIYIKQDNNKISIYYIFKKFLKFLNLYKKNKKKIIFGYLKNKKIKKKIKINKIKKIINNNYKNIILKKFNLYKNFYKLNFFKIINYLFFKKKIFNINKIYKIYNYNFLNKKKILLLILNILLIFKKEFNINIKKKNFKYKKINFFYNKKIIINNLLIKKKKKFLIKIIFNDKLNNIKYINNIFKNIIYFKKKIIYGLIINIKNFKINNIIKIFL
ncbi:MAG: UvrD-helicase domain-containing protein [Candidatus Shikimatogenerans bostrichidophilus]|nr:MAG: UvrD-helicase domain-containing protein [Candidatus Shikimatogenerans bostrichidophilus]